MPGKQGPTYDEMTPGGFAATTFNLLPHYSSYNKNLMTPLGITISPMGVQTDNSQHNGHFFNVQ